MRRRAPPGREACGPAPRAAAIVIRPAAAADVRAVAVLTARSIPTAWSEASLTAELADPNARSIVANVAGAGAPQGPVGYLLAHRIVDELHVLLLAVEPAWRRRGIASALVGQALAEARRAGLRAALLEVRAGNEAACALYRGFGFREVGRRRRYYEDGEDAVLLTLTLDAGEDAPGAPR